MRLIRHFAALAFSIAVVHFGFSQVTVDYPYNPDANGDNFIELLDVLDLLAVYDGPFEPESITIDGLPLESYLEQLLATINGLQRVTNVELTDTNALLFTFSDGSTFTSPPIPTEGGGLPSGDNATEGQFLMWNGSEWVIAAPVVGCMDDTACNYNPGATANLQSLCEFLDACGICNGPGAIYECGCADIPDGDCDCDGNTLDALGNCGGGCAEDLDNDGICDDGDECVGQADECGVCNGPGAIYDCGCTPIPEGFCDCNGTEDLDGDGICDDVDDCVGEYDVTGVCNGGCETDADGDGICDDNGFDDCEGTVDACGVCNGPGPIYECGCNDIPEGDCDCLGNQPNSFGECPDYLADNDGDGIFDEVLDPCLGQTQYTYNGHSYDLLVLEGRCWFKDNLRTLHNRGGEPISEVTDHGEWNGLTDAAWCAYDNDTALVDTYGLLYNGYAASADVGVLNLPEKALCPPFWSPPTQDEWQALIDTLGGNAVAGGALKEAGTAHWSAPNTDASNLTGFTALPGGERPIGTNDFDGLGERAIFWSKGNTIEALAYTQNILHTSGSITSIQHDLNRGHSVRCVRGAPVLGCTQINYLEYNPAANVNDGSCATEAIAGCTDPEYYEFDPNAEVEDGSCAELVGCGPDDVVEFDGYTYDLVTIGDQCWFAENLRSTHYANGDLIPEVQNWDEWLSLNSGAWCAPQNNESYYVLLGGLYNGAANFDERGLCPPGYSVPSQNDYQQLMTLFGGNYSAPFLTAPEYQFNSNWNGNNLSGFTALPAGQRYVSAWWRDLHSWAYFWTSTPDVQMRISAGGAVSIGGENFRTGASIRCIRD